ncbi:MAG: NAD(P)/FAD-dependent oxidoreductase [Candidatus Kapabacteria bacterium]|nr:NAD(P)/FAD-dependent oxidoreductase [Candidatus Kapabacteria bacterium]
MKNHDCLIVGASFAGLACAQAAAQRGLSVTVIERKHDVGAKLHTTGIIVKDVVDTVALLDDMPAKLVRRIDGVRLYSKRMRTVDLHSPGYYFLASDTPELMRWLAQRAESAGAHIEYGANFSTVTRTMHGYDCGQLGHTRYLVGADGPLSTVAQRLSLGRVKDTLFGIEYEFDNVELQEPNLLHCFLDRSIAPGYIGWVLQGVRSVQVGLARRVYGSQRDVNPSMQMFLEKIDHLFGFKGLTPSSIRAGHIPCGGVVSPTATDRAILIGDAAGMVSPVTAGGIHTALFHGQQVGHAITDFLAGRVADPSTWLPSTYPRYRLKRVIRSLYDIIPSDIVFDLMLNTQVLRSAAKVVYFHARK